MDSNGTVSERYNPITGTGIPANPARKNTSAIFGGSPGSIEYMFIPPSGTTRPTIPSSSYDRRRSTSRESLRRSFTTVSEGQPDSDECSSVSDVSECGSEAERIRRNSNTSLGKTRKPLTRSTSTRLPVSFTKPRVMKRAHSFTRETHPTRGATNDTRATHSASDLTKQAKRPAATSKIPRKPQTGAQSSRTGNVPGRSGDENVAVKRTAAEPQASGIPVKGTAVQKRSPDDSGAERKTGTSSGIPVKSSGRKSPLHPGNSKIPQSAKRDKTQVSKNNDAKNESEGLRQSVEAMRAGEPLLKREGTGDELRVEGTGDELRVTKPDSTKSKLPRKSSIPRASSFKAAQQRTMNGENAGGKSEKNKPNTNNDGYQSGKGGTVEQHGVSKMPVNKRAEAKNAGLSSPTQKTESSRGVTSPASREEKPAVEPGNEFSLSRENSRSMIPIMSRKGRVSTDTSGRVPNSESSKPVQGMVTTRENEKQQRELRAGDGEDSERTVGTKNGPNMPVQQGTESGKRGNASETSSRGETREQAEKKEPEILSVSGGKQQECEVYERADERKATPDNLSRETSTKDRDVMAIKGNHVTEKTEVVLERESLVTRMENSRQDDSQVSRNKAVTASISTPVDLPGSEPNHCNVCDVNTSISPLKGHGISLPGSLQDGVANHTEKRNDKKTGAQGTSLPGSLQDGVANHTEKSNDKKTGAQGTSLPGSLQDRVANHTEKSNDKKTGAHGTSHPGNLHDRVANHTERSNDKKTGAHGTSHPGNLQDGVANHTERSNDKKTGAQGTSLPGSLQDGVANHTERNNDKKTGAQGTSLPGSLQDGVANHTERNNDKKTGAHGTSGVANQTEKRNDKKTGAKMDSQEPCEESGKVSSPLGPGYSKIAQSLETKNPGQTDEKNIDDGGLSLRGKVGQLYLEEPLKNKLRNKENIGEKIEDRIKASEVRNLGNEKHDEIHKGTDSVEEASHFSGFDEGLAFTGVEEEDKPVKSFENCMECRLGRSEENGDQFSEINKVSEENSSNIRRYPTFLSPRKSLVLCEYHVKLKSESGEPCEGLLQKNSQSATNNDQALDVSPRPVPAGSQDLAKPEHDQNETGEKIKLKKAVPDRLNNDVSQRPSELSAMDRFQKETPALKSKDRKKFRKEETQSRMQKETAQAVNPSCGINTEPAVEALGKRVTAANVACEKNGRDNGVVPKAGGSPLLALSRDKKYVSGENLASPKTAEAIKNAFSLEWDDVGTELSPPNFSEEEEDIVVEPGSKKQGEDVEDNRRPSVKLMDTNEAMDKLRMIQSLIMKEAENRSRKVSGESAGKRAVDAEGPGEQQREARNNGRYGGPTLDRQLSGDNQEIENVEANLHELSPTSEAPKREVSSPTIWDRISDNITSQDQTTELLNETLAKLKASPQLSGGTALARRTLSSRSLPGSRQASKERLLSDTERPVCVYTSSWMNASGKNSVASSLSLCSANRSLPSSRQNLAKDPFSALNRSESLSGRLEKDNEKQTEYARKEFRLSNFDEMLSDDGQQEVNNQMLTNNKPVVSPVSETSGTTNEAPSKKSAKKMSKRKKSKNSAQTAIDNAPAYGVSMDDLTNGQATCQCGKKGCVIS